MKRETGKYASLSDLINRADPKDVNKLQLEGLVKAGSLDEFDNDRNKILTSILRLFNRLKINMKKKIIIKRIF